MECEFLYPNNDDHTNIYYVTIWKAVTNGNYRSITFYAYDAVNGTPVRSATTVDTIYNFFTSNRFPPCTNATALNNAYKMIAVGGSITLPDNPHGYLIAASLFTRDTSIVSIYDPANSGILFTTTIPGFMNGIDYHRNKSLQFSINDTMTVCRNTSFSFPFTATDPDGDSISYSIGNAVDGVRDPGTSPPNIPVQYWAQYSGTDPLGTGVFSIDPVTGTLTGTAPDKPGGYTIAVYASEWRNGVLLNTAKKESQIKVTSCPFVKPLLKPLYSNCKIFTFNFKAEQPTCPAITTYRWDFGDLTTNADTSHLAMPTYTYPGVGTYTLKLNITGDNGFIDSATATIKIFNSISVKLVTDTAVCMTDNTILNPISDAVNYVWKESGGGNTLSNYYVKNPKALPVMQNTVYSVTGTLGLCTDSATIIVHASPYPTVKASADTAICVGNSIRLNGVINASYFNWSPVTALSNNTILNPVATPVNTTSYILSVRDTFYCPKTVSDTVTIKVIQKFITFAGNDTFAIIGQPLQLNGSSPGNTATLQYSWQPTSFLNNGTIQNPVATFNVAAPDIVAFTLTATTKEGCAATDDVKITVFKSGPAILVPTGFTPNGDGKNDVLKPILIGITKLDYFTVYNRYGQAVFTTSEVNKGWNGAISSGELLTGAYLYMVQGKDYTGKKIFKKGMVMLISKAK